MGVLVAFVIGGIMGFFFSALLSSCSWDEAYTEGAERAKETILSRLTSMVDTCPQVEEVIRIVQNL